MTGICVICLAWRLKQESHQLSPSIIPSGKPQKAGVTGLSDRLAIPSRRVFASDRLSQFNNPRLAPPSAEPTTAADFPHHQYSRLPTSPEQRSRSEAGCGPDFPTEISRTLRTVNQPHDAAIPSHHRERQQNRHFNPRRFVCAQARLHALHALRSLCG